jgi:hypothetical protein
MTAARRESVHLTAGRAGERRVAHLDRRREGARGHVERHFLVMLPPGSMSITIELLFIAAAASASAAHACPAESPLAVQAGRAPKTRPTTAKTPTAIHGRLRCRSRRNRAHSLINLANSTLSSATGVALRITSATVTIWPAGQ